MQRGAQLSEQLHGLKEEFLQMQRRHELLMIELGKSQQQATQT